MKQYGLIGYPLSHSFSKKYFTEKFAREQREDCSYDLFPIAAVSELPYLLAGHPFLKGLNVTIPYKEQVLPLLHNLSATVQEVGACNCIDIQNGLLTGHNTDVIGFEQSIRHKWKPHHAHALILGTGGAAKAVAWVLKQMGVEYRFVSRQPNSGNEIISYAQVTEELLQRYLFIINTTPLGMHPHPNSCPPLLYESVTKNHFFFDLIYNPAESLFLQKGKARGAEVENGAAMLIVQAEESWKIWNVY